MIPNSQAVQDDPFLLFHVLMIFTCQYLPDANAGIKLPQYFVRYVE